MADEEQMMSGEQFAQRNRAAAPGDAHQPPGRRRAESGAENGAEDGSGPTGAPAPPSARPPAPPAGGQLPAQQPPPSAPPRQPGPPAAPAGGPPPQGRRPAPAQQPPAQHRPPQHQQPPAQQQPQQPTAPPERSVHASWGPPPERETPPAPAPPQPPSPVSADAFLEGRQRTAPIGPATWGWRGLVRRLTFGLVSPTMGKAEQAHHRDRGTVQRSFAGPKTIVFVNPKGGAAKTTSVLMAGYTFGTVRGGGVVAWDNNETRGTLGVRGLRAGHNNTARELLAARDRFSDVYSARLGDLGGYVRSQGEAHFDLLASDEQPGVTGTIRAHDFRNLHVLLNRFYRLLLVDTGNNIRAENWLAAVDSADLLVVTTTVREDTGYSGLWMLDALQAEGRGDLVERSVTILSDPASKVDADLAQSLTEAYESRSRAVVRVPFDPVLVSGSVVDYSRLSDATRDAWLRACSAMAEAL